MPISNSDFWFFAGRFWHFYVENKLSLGIYNIICRSTSNMPALPVLKLISRALKLHKIFLLCFWKKYFGIFFNSWGSGAHGPFFIAQIFLQCIITSVTKIMGKIASLYSSEGFKSFKWKVILCSGVLINVLLPQA